MNLTAWTVAAVALTACCSAAAMDPGWSVRICRGQSEASAMKIMVGTKSADTLLVNWQSDNGQTTFALPEKLATAKDISVMIDSEPADGKVTACVMWQGKPAKMMKFNDLMSVTATQTDSDPACPCK
jgi:3-dehydroquinate synthase class II